MQYSNFQYGGEPILIQHIFNRFRSHTGNDFDILPFVALLVTGVVVVVEFLSVVVVLLFLYFSGFSNLSQGGQNQLIGILDSSSFTI